MALITKIRGNTQIMDVTIKDQQIAPDAAIATSKLAEGAEFIKRDGSVIFINNLDMGGYRIINVADPVNDLDVVNKRYVYANFVTPSVIVKRDATQQVPDGTRTQFTLSRTPVAGSEHVYVNGILMEPGLDADYTISGNVITFNTPPLVGDRIRVSYIAQQ